jgi:hypothetical protein
MILSPRRCAICRTRWMVLLREGVCWPARVLGLVETPCGWCSEALHAHAG